MEIIHSNCAYCGKPVDRKAQSVKVNVKLHFCNIECKSEWQRNQKPVDKEWLYQKYIIEKLDCTQISKIVHRNSKQVWNWIHDYGIPLRHRGGFTSTNCFKKGAVGFWAGKKHSQEAKDKMRQARIKDGHYPKQPNGLPYWKGKSGSIMPSWNGGVSPERQSEYNKPEWKCAVKVVWQRDNAICQRCGLDHRTINREEIQFAIHHIISFRYKQLRSNPDCLVLLCFRCHRFVHSKKNIDREWLADDRRSSKPGNG
jgi:hypothetical protein